MIPQLRSEILSIPLIEKENLVFYDKPKIYEINERGHSKYFTMQSIEFLIDELKTRGPFVAFGSFGCAGDSDCIIELNEELGSRNILGWHPRKASNGPPLSNFLLILGAKNTLTQEKIYFSFCSDITPDVNNSIRTLIASEIDQNIYFISHKIFQKYLIKFYPPHKF